MSKITYPMIIFTTLFIILLFFKKNPQINKSNLKTEIQMKSQSDVLRCYEEKQLIYEKMLKEFPDKCFGLQIWAVNYEKTNIMHENHCDNDIKHKRSKCEGRISYETPRKDKKNWKINDDKVNIHEKPVAKMSQNKVNNTTQASNSIVYVFVIFLIFSLIRAGMDISNQLKKNAEQEKNQFSRRCSLHEYAQSRHSRRNSRKRIISRQSSIQTPSTPLLPFINGLNIFGRIFENAKCATNNKTTYTIPAVPILTSTPKAKSANCSNPPTPVLEGSPAKAGKLIAGKPAPLIRRSSFPVMVGQNLCGNKTTGRVRRPSMDSLSEGDSSPDSRRRIRMIHRH